MTTNDDELATEPAEPITADAVEVEFIELPEGAIVHAESDVVALDPSIREANGAGDQTGGMGPL